MGAEGIILAKSLNSNLLRACAIVHCLTLSVTCQRIKHLSKVQHWKVKTSEQMICQIKACNPFQMINGWVEIWEGQLTWLNYDLSTSKSLKKSETDVSDLCPPLNQSTCACVIIAPCVLFSIKWEKQARVGLPD